MLKQVLKIGLGLSLVATAVLAEPEKKKLKIGFIALTDCAPLFIAKEKGFFKKYGLLDLIVINGRFNKQILEDVHNCMFFKSFFCIEKELLN